MRASKGFSNADREDVGSCMGEGEGTGADGVGKSVGGRLGAGEGDELVGRCVADDGGDGATIMRDHDGWSSPSPSP